jgi:uncharacterized protein YebE (UPF0316 family)
MTASILLNCLLIVLARVADVSLGTVRTVAVINGRRTVAWLLGFVEVLIWVLVVSAVIQQISQHWAYPVAYALGFATGNYIGITIEQYFAYGHQVIRVFTRQGEEMSRKMREKGLPVTMFEGQGRDGPVQMLFIETQRKCMREVITHARTLDGACFYLIDDIRAVSQSPRK